MSKNTGGRPTVMTQATIDKLEQAFSIGCSDDEACIYAGISRATLYNYQKDNAEFLDRKELLKKKVVLMARQTIVKSIQDGDVQSSWNMVRSKCGDEFNPANRNEHTGKNGGPITTTELTAEEALKQADGLDEEL